MTFAIDWALNVKKIEDNSSLKSSQARHLTRYRQPVICLYLQQPSVAFRFLCLSWFCLLTKGSSRNTLPPFIFQVGLLLPLPSSYFSTQPVFSEAAAKWDAFAFFSHYPFPPTFRDSQQILPTLQAVRWGPKLMTCTTSRGWRSPILTATYT